MNSKYSKELNHILDLGREEAQRTNSAEIEPVHILLGMLQADGNTGLGLLEKQGVNICNLRQRSEYWIKQHNILATKENEALSISRRTEKLLRLTMLESMVAHAPEAEAKHLLLAIMKENSNEAHKLLTEDNISYKSTQGAMNQTLETPNGSQSHGNDGSQSAASGLDNSLISEKQGTSSNPLASMSIDDNEEEMSPNNIGGTMSQTKEKKTGTPMLDNFGHDLTRAAQMGLLDPVVGREDEILRVSQILSRRKKNNPILIGQPGVGKNAIVEGLAMRIVKRQVARVLMDKRIVSLDLAAVVAGTKYRGQFEERMRNIVREVQGNKNIILFIDEIHTLIGAGGAEGTMDAANILKPALSRGELQCIGATTIEEYRKSIEKDGALERRFQKIMVEPTTPSDTLKILKNLQERYEEHHNVKYTDAALRACVKLTDRYISERSFPDKAIDAMDETGASVHIKRLPVNNRLEELEAELEETGRKKQAALSERNFATAALMLEQSASIAKEIDEERKRWESEIDNGRLIVDEGDVANVVSQITGIPTQRITEDETERLRDMQGKLQEQVVGQDDAIKHIVRAIQRSRVGLKDPDKPIGVFMFLGPTGVGKTFLTKKLSEIMFGTTDALIRVDMSEFMEKHTVSRLVGAPPGYVGYEEGGQLTERVRRHPYSIILLDEIEKAHQDVFNILLQVMDEGRLTDNNGKTVDFKNTIIIMTSNCGTRQLKDFAHGIGFGSRNDETDSKFGRDIIQKALNKQFAPEFLNRLDDIVYFNQLTRTDILKMVNLELKPLTERVQQMGYSLAVSDSAKEFLAAKGYDVQYGARPLARCLQTHIEDRICEMVINGEITKGQTIEVTANDGDLRFNIGAGV